MADKRCFVQFPHPGKEHQPSTGRVWHRQCRDHKRKFMQLRGAWIEEDTATQCGDLWAWGEWEPESDIVCTLDPAGNGSRYPRVLWAPCYIPKSDDDYSKLHNTDPFIFGKHFLYSNCRQGNDRSTLKRLARGSIIAFGSGKKINGEPRWTLDTVLVIKDSVDYSPYRARTDLKDWAPDTFLEVCGGPFSACPESWRFRLYRGATPDEPVDGMFSFFPAIPAGGGTGFPRPSINLPDKYFNPASWRTVKGLRDERSCGELQSLWKCLVKQVRDAGLVLGTYAELPKPRAE